MQFCALHSKQQYLDSHGQAAKFSQRFGYLLSYVSDKYDVNVSIWLSTSELFRHLNCTFLPFVKKFNSNP